MGEWADYWYPETGTAGSSQRICGCGHRVTDHDAGRCLETWRYPDVLNARLCGCEGVWMPGPEDSRFERWRDQERRAAVTP